VIKPLRSMLDTIVERTVGGELPSSEEATDIIEQLVSSGAISMKKYSSVFYRAETVTAEAADEPLIASIGLANLWCIHVNGSFSKHQCYDEYEKYLSDQFVEL